MSSVGINRAVEAWQSTSIAASSISNGAEAATGAIDLNGYIGAEVSVEFGYGLTASAGAQIHVLGDIDGSTYEARADLPWGFELPRTVSTTHRRRFFIDARDYASPKVNVYNPSGASGTATVRYRRIQGVIS